IFDNKAKCATCHVPPIFTEPGWNLHDASDIGIDDFQASRSPNGKYRTTPLCGLFARMKGGFYHANDLGGCLVELNESSDDGRIAVKAALPQCVAEHDDRRGHRPVVLLRNHAAEERWYAQQREELRRHNLTVEPLGFADASQRRPS